MDWGNLSSDEDEEDKHELEHPEPAPTTETTQGTQPAESRQDKEKEKPNIVPYKERLHGNKYRNKIKGGFRPELLEAKKHGIRPSVRSPEMVEKPLGLDRPGARLRRGAAESVLLGRGRPGGHKG